MAAGHFKGCPITENTCPIKMISIYVWNMISYLSLVKIVFSYFWILHNSLQIHAPFMLSVKAWLKLIILVCNSIDTMFVYMQFEWTSCCRTKDMLN